MQTNAFGSGDKTPSFARITGRCQVHLPFAVLLERLDWVLANRLQPEIGLEGDTLYATPAAQFARAAAGLRQAGLGCTLHAPFLDLADPLCPPGGRVICMKGAKADEEIADWRQGNTPTPFHLAETRRLNLPFSGDARTLILVLRQGAGLTRNPHRRQA